MRSEFNRESQRTQNRRPIWYLRKSLDIVLQSTLTKSCEVVVGTMSGLKTGLSITGLLVFGTTTSLFAKIGKTPDTTLQSARGPCIVHNMSSTIWVAVYELQGPDKQGNMKFFTKPWAMTTVMFLGMSFCLPWAYWQEHKHKRQAQEALTSGNGSVGDPLLYGESLVSIAGRDKQRRRSGSCASTTCN